MSFICDSKYTSNHHFCFGAIFKQKNWRLNKNSQLHHLRWTSPSLFSEQTQPIFSKHSVSIFQKHCCKRDKYFWWDLKDSTQQSNPQKYQESIFYFHHVFTNHNTMHATVINIIMNMNVIQPIKNTKIIDPWTVSNKCLVKTGAQTT